MIADKKPDAYDDLCHELRHCSTELRALWKPALEIVFRQIAILKRLECALNKYGECLKAADDSPEL